MYLKIGDRIFTAHFQHTNGHFGYCTVCCFHTAMIEWKDCQADKDVGYRGRAFCSPGDQFCKATGRKIALARAIEELPRTLRKQIWQAYFAITSY